LQVLQEVFELPIDRWDFSEFYSGKPEDTDRFLCKVLAAGVLATYLDIITKKDIGDGVAQQGGKNPVERLIHLFDAFVEKASLRDIQNPVDFDPFKYDEGLGDIHVAREIREEYVKRVEEFFDTFQQEFGVLSCQEILGFDPLLYDQYDEEMQEHIEEGEWMQKCIKCMDNITTHAIMEKS
jgi:hypothetical protein